MQRQAMRTIAGGIILALVTIVIAAQLIRSMLDGYERGLLRGFVNLTVCCLLLSIQIGFVFGAGTGIFVSLLIFVVALFFTIVSALGAEARARRAETRAKARARRRAENPWTKIRAEIRKRRASGTSLATPPSA
jgi:hypothetical protein